MADSEGGQALASIALENDEKVLGKRAERSAKERSILIVMENQEVENPPP